MAPYTRFLNAVAHVMATQNLPSDHYGRVFLELLRSGYLAVYVMVVGMIVTGEVDVADMGVSIHPKVAAFCEEQINQHWVKDVVARKR